MSGAASVVVGIFIFKLENINEQRSMLISSTVLIQVEIIPMFKSDQLFKLIPRTASMTYRYSCWYIDQSINQ